MRTIRPVYDPPTDRDARRLAARASASLGMTLARILHAAAFVFNRLGWLAVLALWVWYMVSDDEGFGFRLQEFLRDAWVNISFALYDSPSTHRLYLLVADWLS